MHKIIRKILPAVLTASLLVPIPILGEEISASEISLEGTAAEEAAAEAGTAKEAAAEEETAEETVTEEETSTEAAAENTGEAAAAQQSADVEASGEVIEETAVRDTAGTVSEEEDAGTSPAETAGTESSAELTAGTESPAEETSSGENSLAGETEEVPEMELTGEASSAEETSEAETFEEETESEEEADGTETAAVSTEDAVAAQSQVFSDAYIVSTAVLYAGRDTSARVLGTAAAGQKVYVLDLTTMESGAAWVHIVFEVNGYGYEAYVDADVLGTNARMMLLAAAAQPSFPASYQTYIDALQAAHPTWTFVPVMVGDTFDYAVSQEMAVPGRALVNTYYNEGWYSVLDRDYDASTNTWKQYEPGWVGASEDAVRWSMDPRNFLNEYNIFMFESLAYANQTEDTVQALLNGTFMSGNVPGEDYTYAWLFCWIGQKYNINPAALASRCLQEQGSGTSDLISGTYQGYENLYNYFNMSATGSTREEIVTNGLKEAQTGSTILLPDGTESEGAWDTPAKAIIGGSLKFAGLYVEKNQNTLYAQKYDYNGEYQGKYWHQYMTNIHAPYAEGNFVRKSYSLKNLLESAFTFLIPVYDDMSDTVSAKPVDRKNGNTFLQSITVNGEELIETFDASGTSYSVNVGDTTDAEVSATASAATSTVSFENPEELTAPTTECLITVTAEDGSRRTYTLTIATDYKFPTPTVYEGTDYAGVFDAEWYLDHYADLAAAFGTDYDAALKHFVTCGIAEGRQGCADFDVTIYKKNYADLRAVFGNNNAAYIDHYLTYGKAEGRTGAELLEEEKPAVTYPTVSEGTDYADVFDAVWYLNHYTDLAAAFGTDYEAALKHFVTCGIAEGRQACASFSVTAYRDRYADLRAAFGNNLAAYVQHYLTCGKVENRVGN